jgi:hypothetical protein
MTRAGSSSPPTRNGPRPATPAATLISGEHPDWDEYREAMVAQGKSLLRITPRSWGPVATGGFPARLA